MRRNHYKNYPGVEAVASTFYGMNMATLDVLFHFGELLSGHEREAMDYALGGYGDALPFRYEDCRILITGIPVQVYHRYGWRQPDAFAFLVQEYHPAAKELLQRYGYEGISLIYLFDGHKRLVTIFSPATATPGDPYKMAEELTDKMQARYARRLFNGEGDCCNFTALSEPLHAFEEIAPAFARLRAMVELSFFHMEPMVLSAPRLAALRVPMDEVAFAEECRALRGSLADGNAEGAVAELNSLFFHHIKPSFDSRRLEDLLLCCKNALRTCGLTYGVTLEQDLDELCDRSRYVTLEGCHQAVQAAMTTLCRLVGGRAHGYSYITKEAVYYIRTHYAKEISLSAIATYVNVVPTYLSSVFKRETGQTISSYLAEVRLERAKELLETTKLRIAEVGSAVGIPNAGYFSAFFKKSTALSPADYRARHRS